MHFYMRNAKKEDVDKFKKDHKLKHLGMPIFIGAGSQDVEEMKHRFLVMPRYGRDIWKIFLEQNRKFPLHTVYRLGIQLIDVLEYIHSANYVHMDLKGSNILLGFGKGGEEHIHLLDFGLACHYNTKEYKIDPKKAHNGTIEYTSRDAHNGVATMRGDIEILAYNLIEWAGAKLPWTSPASLLTKPVEVQKLKESFMKDVEKSLKSAFGAVSVPSQLAILMKYVESIKHDTQPDYAKIRGMFESGLKELKASNSGKLEFITKAATAVANSPMKRVATSAPKVTSSPAKKAKVAVAGTSKNVKEVSPAKQARPVTAKSKVLVPDSGSSDTEEEVIQKTKRTRAQPARYVEVNSEESDDDVPPVNKPSTSKAAKEKSPVKKPSTSKAAKEKSENKNSNSAATASSPKKKPTKTDVNAKAKGKVVLKSKSEGGPKKTVTLNFDLDISYDSDLIVTVNRKNKTDASNADDKQKEKSKESNNTNQAGFYNGKFAKT